MITHDFKLIYVHIPKCAGRSIADMFHQRFEHHPAEYYYHCYSSVFFEYEKFTTVRNPYSRLVSMYKFISEHRRFKNEPVAAGTDGSKDQFNKWLEANMTAYKANGPFSPSSLCADIGNDFALGSAFWFSPQASYLGAYANQFKVFRVEEIDTLEQWLQTKKSRYEGTSPISALQHLNKSDHGLWWQYYNQKSIDILIDSPVHLDCKAFNYAIL